MSLPRHGHKLRNQVFTEEYKLILRRSDEILLQERRLEHCFPRADEMPANIAWFTAIRHLIGDLGNTESLTSADDSFCVQSTDPEHRKN